MTVQEKMMQSEDQEDHKEEGIIRKKAGSHPVFMISKSWCAYCRKAKQLLDGLHCEYHLLELEDKDHSPRALGSEDQWKKAISDTTGSSSVPKIWIGNTMIGGHDDLMELHAAGKLLKTIQEAGGLKNQSKEEQTIRQQAKAHPVFILSKKWSPCAEKAKETFDRIGAHYCVLELEDEEKNLIVPGKEEDWQRAIKHATGSISIPKVWVGGKLIGGGGDVEAALSSGDLPVLILDAGGTLSSKKLSEVEIHLEQSKETLKQEEATKNKIATERSRGSGMGRSDSFRGAVWF